MSESSGAVRAAVPPPEAWPTVDGVAALLRARTKTNTGVEVGTFTDDTRPTGTQVTAHIADAVQAVADELAGAEVPESLYGSFSWCVKRYVACDIEKSYFPEQVQSSRSAYDQLWAQYLRAIEALQARLPSEGDGSLQASGIGVLGLRRPYGGRCCQSGLGSPPGFPDRECAVVNYDDPWC